jgi:hypothetical protein
VDIVPRYRAILIGFRSRNRPEPLFRLPIISAIAVASAALVETEGG